LAGAGGGEIGEVHAGHAEDEEGDDREGDDRLPVVAGTAGTGLGVAEMDIADVDQGIVGIVGLVDDGLADMLVGNVAAFPRRHLLVELGDVGARPQRRIEPAGLPAPLGHELRLFGMVAGRVDPHEHVEIHVRIQRQIPIDGRDAMIDLLAADHHRQCLADRIVGAEQPPRLGL
jgi:hypothetical protein